MSPMAAVCASLGVGLTHQFSVLGDKLVDAERLGALWARFRGG